MHVLLFLIKWKVMNILFPKVGGAEPHHYQNWWGSSPHCLHSSYTYVHHSDNSVTVMKNNFKKSPKIIGTPSLSVGS